MEIEKKYELNKNYLEMVLSGDKDYDVYSNIIFDNSSVSLLASKLFGIRCNENMFKVKDKSLKLDKNYNIIFNFIDENYGPFKLLSENGITDDDEPLKFKDKSHILFLNGKYLVYFNREKDYFNVYSSSKELFDIDKNVKIFLKKTRLGIPRKFIKNKPRIGLLTCKNGTLDVLFEPIKSVKLDTNLTYNDDFKDVHDIIVKRLKTIDDKGLVLLHGEPGTGKTTFIRYLLTHLSKSKKKIIYISPDNAHVLSQPEFLDLVKNYKNSIFVIEDAESILMSRNNNQSNSGVQALLNFGDGILSDVYHNQFVCTFNTSILNIDQALTRKGRLIALYEFKKLTVEKAQALSNSIGHTTSIIEEMTLAEVYTQEEKKFKQEKKFIGFSVN